MRVRAPAQPTFIAPHREHAPAMPNTYNISQVGDYNRLRAVPTVHPLVSVIDFAALDAATQHGSRPDIHALHYRCYAVFLKQGPQCSLHYGRRPYDYQEGTLVFVSPGQTLTVNTGHGLPPRPVAGHALLFHPDLLAGTPLAERIHDYRFLSYEVAEGLHVSDRERATVLDCLAKIDDESRGNLDAHSRRLIVSTLQLLLDYCQRFYGRQFHTRFRENQDVLLRLERLLHDYFERGRAEAEGLPTVQVLAKALHLSPNYFGDLVSKEVGRSPRDLIRAKTLELAKLRLLQPELSISEVAYGLGFKHPQHFTRFFKGQTGQTPSAYQAAR